jgi:hypothetical protein
LIGRGSPQSAANTGQLDHQVGRPAKYKTFGKYAGGVFPVFASINRPDWRGGAVNTGNVMRVTVAAALPLAVAASPASAKEPIDWTAYPEMARERALPQIAAALRNILFDVDSVTNFMMCYPPVKVKLKDGRPVRWTIMLSLNSKNQYGGYAGNQGMAAVFYANKPVWTFSLQMPLDAETLAGCARVPDAEIQRLIQGE